MGMGRDDGGDGVVLTGPRHNPPTNQTRLVTKRRKGWTRRERSDGKEKGEKEWLRKRTKSGRMEQKRKEGKTENIMVKEDEEERKGRIKRERKE